jgi:tagatose 6-phosphate kinase
VVVMEKPKKIATVTLNPALDISYTFEEFRLGHSNRTEEPHQSAGGKGINVSRVINILGEDVLATGFLGGATGQFIHEQLQQFAIDDKFISIAGETRRCYAFLDRTGGSHTEVLERGPYISVDQQSKLKDMFSQMLNEVDVAVVSGSLPKGVDSALYQFLLDEAKQHQVKVLLDTSGQTLKDCLNRQPYMIKPNRQEVEQILGTEIRSEQEIWRAVQLLAANGIPLVILSDGENGAYVMYEERAYRVPTHNIEVINPVGSGDAFVAGMAVGITRNLPIEQSLSLASACGAANAMEARTGYVSVENVNAIAEAIQANISSSLVTVEQN